MPIVRGAEQLAKVLAKLPDDVDKLAVAAITRGAEIIRVGMASRAPVRTGRLAGSIVVDVKVVKAGPLVRVGPDKKRFYGRFQEFGTKRHAAHPFMKPALDEDGPTAMRLIGMELKRSLDEVARVRATTEGTPK